MKYPVWKEQAILKEFSELSIAEKKKKKINLFSSFYKAKYAAECLGIFAQQYGNERGNLRLFTI